MSTATKAPKVVQETVALLEALPDNAAKVLARGNHAKGVVSKAAADKTVAAGMAVIGDDGRLTLTTGTPVTQDSPGVPDGPAPDPWEYPEGEGPEDRADQADQATPTQSEEPAKATPAKVNGRKAKADASPYSTAPVTGFQKRHGKSRRTGSETEIVDLLHAKGKDRDAKAHAALVAKTAKGRYRVECITHSKHRDVPDMTTAKPLQARTDEFCTKCARAVAEKGTDTTAA